MTIQEIQKDLINAKSVKVNKNPNNLGFFSYQYHNGNKWQIGTFKTYQDAITFFYVEGFTKDKQYNNFVILEKEQ